MANAIFGFIGCGNMGSAIIGGVIASGYATPDEIIAEVEKQLGVISD